MQSMGSDRAERRQGVPRDVLAGLFLIAIAGVSLWGLWDLPVGESSGIGPGLVPKTVAGLIGLFGLLLLAIGFAPGAEAVERMSLRGPLFVLGSVVVFAATIRTLGLAMAGPLAVIIAAFGTKESRPVEVLVFALVTTAFCIGLFKFVLRLPVPLAPMLLGY